MGFGQYKLDSAVFHDVLSCSSALITTRLEGFVSGRGTQHFKSIGNNLDDTGRTGVKAILTAFDKYGTSACYQKYLTYVEVELQILLQNLFHKTLQKVH